MSHKAPFLALTSDRRFWDTSGEVVFLGEWCLDETSCRQEISFPHSIISSPWNHNRHMDRISAYLEEFSEKLLVHLSRELDRFHGLNGGLWAWRIIAGNWVFHVVHTLFDRFFLLDEAVRIYGKLSTRVPLPREADIPRTILNFKMAQLYPDTALSVFGRLAEAMGLECERLESPVIDQAKFVSRKKTSGQWKERLKDIVRPWLSIGNPIIFCDSGVGAALVKEMRVSGTGVTNTEQWHPARCNPVNMGLRTELFENFETSDRFQQLALKVLPFFLPASLLEDFPSWNSKAKSFPWGKKAKVLVTAHGFSGSELFALRAVRLLQNGCRFVGMQHGGAYGIFGYCPEEFHETKCSDIYVTWGWRNNEKQRPMPSLHLADVLKKKRPAEADPHGILLVTVARPHLAHRVMSHPLSGQMPRYYSWQERFYERLSQNLKLELFLKPAIYDFSPNTAPWVNDRSIRVVGGRLPDMLNRFRLLVFDANGTGFLEALACNIPTLVFWDKELWEIRDSAVPYFEKLQSVGIFHNTPESAAAQLNDIFEAVDGWWSGRPLQNARKEFCDTYARVNNWQREWMDFLSQYK